MFPIQKSKIIIAFALLSTALVFSCKGGAGSSNNSNPSRGDGGGSGSASGSGSGSGSASGSGSGSGSASGSGSGSGSGGGSIIPQVGLQKAGNSVYAYYADGSTASGGYSRAEADAKLLLNHPEIKYISPDVGYLIFNTKQGDYVGAEPGFWYLDQKMDALQNNFTSANIDGLGERYKKVNPNLIYVPIYEFSSKIHGYMPTLTESIGPDVQAGTSPYIGNNPSGQDVNQIQLFAHNLTDPICASPTSGGLQLDDEPFQMTGQTPELYKAMKDNLATCGKFIQAYAFATAMPPEIMLAFSSTGALIPSLYDDTQAGTAPLNFDYYEKVLKYDSDWSHDSHVGCHPPMSGSQYEINSYCNYDYDTATYDT